MIKVTVTIQFYIFLLLYILRRKFTYSFLAEKYSWLDTSRAQKLYSIYVLNLNLVYGINMKQATIWIFQWTHDLNRIDCKIWACNLRACEWHVCELQAEQFRSCDLQLDQSVSFYWRVTQYGSCESYQSEQCFKFANEAR